MDSHLALQMNSRKQELLEARFQGFLHPFQLENSTRAAVEVSDQSADAESTSPHSNSPTRLRDNVACEDNAVSEPIVPVTDCIATVAAVAERLALPPVVLSLSSTLSAPVTDWHDGTCSITSTNIINSSPQTPRAKFRKRRAEDSPGTRHKRIDEYLLRRDLVASPKSTVGTSVITPTSAFFLNDDSISNQNSCTDSPYTAQEDQMQATNSSLNGNRAPIKRKIFCNSANGGAAALRNQDRTASQVQLSPIRTNSTQDSSFLHRSVQTDLSHIHIQQLEKASAEDRHDDAQLLDLQRQLGDMDKRIMAQQKLIHQLRDQQEKSKEMIKKLLIEKADLERKATRQTCMENRLRLGQFQTIRHGSHLEEKWLDGFAFREIEKRRQEIEAERERIEKDKRNWQKRKPGSAKSVAAAGRGATGQREDVDNMTAEEFFVQLEIYEQRRMGLLKEEKELKEEQEKMDRERNLHIRELKRIQNEDSSRFRDHIILHQRYLLLCLLGKGGFSEVHKGYDLNDQRYVACKIHQLNPNWPKDKKENYIRHAVREIAIHKTLVHSRIVRVYDVFDIDPDSFCTVLEYNRGNDLDFYLKQNKALSEREGKNIISQVVSALKYLNQRKPPVIHYDLKPGNILLGSNEGTGEIKITDFGLSKLMEEDTYNPEFGMELTSQGAGTYWYLPPECFETGNELPRISSKVDVWSVGVIFFQCLYGRKPFGHNQSQADILHNNTILQARTIEFPATAPGNTKISEQAKKFIQRCCTYNKFLRPDVFQLAEDDYLKSKAQLKSSSITVSSTGFTNMCPPPPPLFDGFRSDGIISSGIGTAIIDSTPSSAGPTCSLAASSASSQLSGASGAAVSQQSTLTHKLASQQMLTNQHSSS